MLLCPRPTVARLKKRIARQTYTASASFAAAAT
jgi:hypothetical protein